MADPKVEGNVKKVHEEVQPKVGENAKKSPEEVQPKAKIGGNVKKSTPEEGKTEINGGTVKKGDLEENHPKFGGIVKKGHEEGQKMSNSLLQEFELPPGLLKLADVIEVGFVRSTGYMWIVQKKKVEHNFKMISKLVSYDIEINGYIERKKIKKLKGVKAKEFLLWPPVNEVVVDSPPTGKMHFKSIGGITKTFPVEAFAAGQ